MACNESHTSSRRRPQALPHELAAAPTLARSATTHHTYGRATGGSAAGEVRPTHAHASGVCSASRHVLDTRRRPGWDALGIDLDGPRPSRSTLESATPGSGGSDSGRRPASSVPAGRAVRADAVAIPGERGRGTQAPLRGRPRHGRPSEVGCTATPLAAALTPSALPRGGASVRYSSRMLGGTCQRRAGSRKCTGRSGGPRRRTAAACEWASEETGGEQGRARKARPVAKVVAQVDAWCRTARSTRKLQCESRSSSVSCKLGGGKKKSSTRREREKRK